MNFDTATSILIEMVKGVIDLVRGLDQDWERAFLRCVVRDSYSEAKVSYATSSATKIVNGMEHQDFFHLAVQDARELLEALGKNQGLFLLEVKSNFEYEVKYEYHDFNKWGISKLGGGSGIPEGLD
jgi:hypothetical protein